MADDSVGEAVPFQRRSFAPFPEVSSAATVERSEELSRAETPPGATDSAVGAEYSVLKVVFYCDCTLIVTRYEKVTKRTTCAELIERVRAFVPVSHQHLGISICVGGSGVALNKDDVLFETLRPMVYVVEMHLDVKALDTTQVKQALVILRSSMIDHDAQSPHEREQDFDVVRVDKGWLRPVTPPRGGSPPAFDAMADERATSTATSESSPKDVIGRTATAKSKCLPEKVFVTYRELPVLKQSQHDRLQGIVDSINELTDRQTTMPVTGYKLVFECKGRDPLEVPSSSLDYALRQLLGFSWSIVLPAFDSTWWFEELHTDTVEVHNGLASVFLVIAEKSHGPPDSHGGHKDGHDRERRRRRKRQDEDRDPSPKKGKFARNEGGQSSDRTSHQSKGGEGKQYGLLPEGLIQGLTPTVPGTPPRGQPALSLDPEWSRAHAPEERLGRGDVGHEGGDCAYGEISPTLDWPNPSQTKPTDGLISSELQRLEELLSVILFHHVPYGGSQGKPLKAFPLIVQSADLSLGMPAGSGDHEAYMVHRGSSDFCSTCFSFLPQRPSVPTCPSCGADCVPPMFPDPDTGGTSQPELQVLRRYVPRPQDVLTSTERCSVEGIVGKQVGKFLRSFLVQDFCGPNDTNECFLMWNCDWFLPVQCNCALFNAQVVGIFLGQPIFGPPSGGSQSALVRRPDPLDDVRVLDLFAGLGGWEYARDFLSPLHDKMAPPMCDTVSVEIDPLWCQGLSCKHSKNSSDTG